MGICVTDKHRRFRKIPPSLLNIKRLKHHEVGESTNFEILWSYIGLKVKWTPFNLKRQIGDYTNFKYTLPE